MSSAFLSVNLFGTPQIWVTESQVRAEPQLIVDSFVSARALTLLCFLICEEGVHTRSSLATLLWSDDSEERAKTNLRTVLSNLRKLVGDYLIIDRQSVQFRHDLPHDCDVLRFRKLLLNDDITQDELEDAISLHQGDFLNDVVIKGKSLAEEWITLEREQLRGMLVGGLTMLSRLQFQSQPDRSIATLKRLLRVEPLDEASHRRLMQALARVGRRQEALAQFEACADILQKELGAKPSAETIALIGNLRQSINTIEHNLPSYGSPMIGRKAELAKIREWLSTHHYRLIDIVAFGGLGKTRLAVESAWQTIQEDEGTNVFEAVYFARLGQLEAMSNEQQERNAVLRLLTDVIGLAEGNENLLTNLVNNLRDRHLLLILDQAEHLKSLGSLVADLLHATINIQFIVTSHSRLQIAEEWILQLEGLSYPPLVDGFGKPYYSVAEPRHEEDADRSDADQALSSFPYETEKGKFSAELQPIEEYDSLQLLFQCAEQQQALEVAKSATRNELIHLSQQLEGSPLAIELAASWLSVLSVAEISHQLSQGLPLLNANQQSSKRVQREPLADPITPYGSKLAAVYDASWGLLNDEEREALQRLTVFRVPFTRQAADVVAQASLPLLARLVHKCLLQRAGEEYFHLSTTLRAYIEYRQPLSQIKLNQTKNKHGLYILEWLASLELELMGKNAAQAATSVAREWTDIEIAWDWQLHTKNEQSINACVRALHEFFNIKGSYQVAVKLFGNGLKAFTQPSQLRARLLLHHGAYQSYLGNYSEGLALVHEARSLLSQFPNAEYVAFSYVLEGESLRYTGHLAESETCHEQVIGLTLPLMNDNPPQWAALGYAWAHYSIGLINLAKLEQMPIQKRSTSKQLYTRSHEMLDIALQTTRQSGHQTYIGWLLSLYGTLEAAIGNLDSAEEYLDGAQTILEEMEHSLQIDNQIARADVAIQRRQFKAAAKMLKSTMNMVQNAPDAPRLLVAVLHSFALWLLCQEKYVAAAQFTAFLIDQKTLTARQKYILAHNTEMLQRCLPHVTYQLAESRGKLMKLESALCQAAGWLSE